MSMKVDSTLSELKRMLGGTRRPNKFDLPSSGRIAMSQINEELGNSPTARLSLRAAADEFGLPSGRVAMSDFYGLSTGWLLTVGEWMNWYGFQSGWDVQEPYGDLQPAKLETWDIYEFHVYFNFGQAANGMLRLNSAGRTDRILFTPDDTNHDPIEFLSLHNNGQYSPSTQTGAQDLYDFMALADPKTFQLEFI